MFKHKSLRFFAGMLFGSTSGVFLGVLLNATMKLRASTTSLEQMDDLLHHIIFGAFFGLVFGGLVGLVRHPIRSGLFAAGVGLAAIVASPLWIEPYREQMNERMYLAGGAMVGAVLAMELGWGIADALRTRRGGLKGRET